MAERVSEDDDYDVDIRRKNFGKSHILNTQPGNDGWLGNPHRLTEEDTRWSECPYCGSQHTRKESVQLYEEILRKKLKNDPDFRKKFNQLHGKTLKSHCSTDELCHGDVIIQILEERENQQEEGSSS